MGVRRQEMKSRPIVMVKTKLEGEIKELWGYWWAKDDEIIGHLAILIENFLLRYKIKHTIKKYEDELSVHIYIYFPKYVNSEITSYLIDKYDLSDFFLVIRNPIIIVEEHEDKNK